MIGLRVPARVTERPGRVGPLLGLVLLITLHLTGHAHAASCDGSDLNLPTVTCAQHEADAGSGKTFAGAPEHRHHAGLHIDHAVDRPRGVSADRPDSAPAPGAVALVPVTVPDSVPVGASGDPPLDPHSLYGSSARALHCVWRQ
ncbi:hypothetical protein ACFWPQ_46380 [Streptomyces sp. NPDC058464]|uniref:hypothetical protein n=1 Tax=Streptomyces sp. NPDC058464 TaxID=3346511 RepID=UPI00365D0CA2